MDVCTVHFSVTQLERMDAHEACTLGGMSPYRNLPASSCMGTSHGRQRVATCTKGPNRCNGTHSMPATYAPQGLQSLPDVCCSYERIKVPTSCRSSALSYLELLAPCPLRPAFNGMASAGGHVFYWWSLWHAALRVPAVEAFQNNSSCSAANPRPGFTPPPTTEYLIHAKEICALAYPCW